MFVADRDNHRVQMFDRSGRYVAGVLADTCSLADGRDVRPVDVAVTSRTRLVVLLAGVEGVDVPAEVRVYQLRCTLPPPDVRSVRDILSTIRARRRSGSPSSPPPPAAALRAPDAASDDDDGAGRRDSRKVRFRLPESQHRPRRPASSDGAVETTADSGDHEPKHSSQVCVIL